MAAHGNRIILTQSRGVHVEGIINAAETPKPGTLYQIDATQAQQGGRHVWKQYTRDADGNRPIGPCIILCEDLLQGKLITDAYAAGDRAFGFIPHAGCELNLLFGNASGTADDVVAGTTLLIPDTGTGKFIPTTGSPEIEPALALSSITDPTADELVWCIWTGY